MWFDYTVCALTCMRPIGLRQLERAWFACCQRTAALSGRWDADTGNHLSSPECSIRSHNRRQFKSDKDTNTSLRIWYWSESAHRVLLCVLRQLQRQEVLYFVTATQSQQQKRACWVNPGLWITLKFKAVRSTVMLMISLAGSSAASVAKQFASCSLSWCTFLICWLFWVTIVQMSTDCSSFTDD